MLSADVIGITAELVAEFCHLIVSRLFIVHFALRLEETFHVRTDKEDDGEDAQDGAEGLEQESAASQDQAIEVVAAARKEPTGDHKSGCPSPSQQHHSGRDNDESPAQRGRRRFSTS